MATTTAYPVSNSGVRVLSRSSWPKGPHPLLRHILSTGIGQDLANHPEAQVNCASPNRRNVRLSNERAAALIGWSVQVRLSRDRRPRPVLPRIGPVQWHGTLAPHNPGVATAIQQASANRCRSAGVDQVPIRQPPRTCRSAISLAGHLRSVDQSWETAPGPNIAAAPGRLSSAPAT